MKSNTKILLIVGIVAFLGILFFLGKPRDKKITPTANLKDAVVSSTISLNETSFDFGKVSMARGKVNHEFVVKNTGSEPVKIDRLYTSCMCTEATFIQKGESLGPFGMPGHGFVPPLRKIVDMGEEVKLNVIFDPAAHGPAGIGPISRVVYLETEKDSKEIEIKAVVTP